MADRSASGPAVYAPLAVMPWQSAEDCAAEALAAAHADKSWLVTGRVNKVAAAAAGPVARGVRRWAAARIASHM